MFDVNTISKRYFQIKIKNITLDVEPPKIKALEKIMSLSKAKDNETIGDLKEAVKMILDKNKTKYKVPNEIIDELDIDQLYEILTAYFNWLTKTKNNPN